MTANVSANFTSTSKDISVLEHPTLSARIVTGLILAVIGLIGGFGNSRVLFTFVKMPTLFSRTTRLILVALAIVDLTGCLVNIPLVFAVLAIRPDRDELYTVSLAHIIVTYCLLWCSYFCFVLIGCDMNDTFRKMARCGTLLTVRRIQAALVAMLVSTLALPFSYTL